MKAEDKLDYAIMSLEQRPVATGAAIGAIRAALGDIARLRAEIAAAERAAVLARGSLIIARGELSRVGMGAHR